MPLSSAFMSPFIIASICHPSYKDLSFFNKLHNTKPYRILDPQVQKIAKNAFNNFFTVLTSQYTTTTTTTTTVTSTRTSGNPANDTITQQTHHTISPAFIPPATLPATVEEEWEVDVRLISFHIQT